MTTPTDDGLREAAKRLRQFEIDASVYPADTNFGPLSWQQVCDLLAVKDAYLSSRDAAGDGDELVTEEWLRGECGNQRCHAASLGLTLAFQKDALGRWWATAIQDDQSVALVEVKTRREVRDLCRVLNIPLPAAGEWEKS